MCSRSWIGQAAGVALALSLATSAFAQQLPGREAHLVPGDGSGRGGVGPANAGLRWEADLASAQRLSAETNRLLLMHFAASWCPPCRRLEQQVFSQPGFGHQLESNFVAVHLDYNQNQALARRLGIQAIPADVIVTPEGQMIRRVQSPATAADYVRTMNQIARDAGRLVGDPYARDAAAAPQRPNAAAGPVDGRADYQPVTNTVPADDRYADYFNRRQAQAQEAIALEHRQPPIDSGSPQREPAEAAAPVAQGYCQVPPYPDQAGYTDPSRPADEPPLGNTQPPFDASRPRQGAMQPPASPQIPPGHPPVGLDGYCPVTLCEQQDWTPGDTRWGAVHRGRTYLFATAHQQQKFLARPDHYSPVLAGHDPVLALDERQAVAGQRQYGVFFDARVYLFASEESLARFSRNPSRYAREITHTLRR